MIGAEKFFSTAVERYLIRQRREADQPLGFGWTQDPVFARWRFCNVHREHDKTTVWFRRNVRDRLHDSSWYHQVASTIIFRWFNRVETGEIIKDLFLDEWTPDSLNEAYHRLKDVHPVVTGAYVIKTQTGVDKLTGILNTAEKMLVRLDSILEPWKKDVETGVDLERAWGDLLAIEYLGAFMAYEVVSDLRWTSVLSTARDIYSWANAGPGCRRGLGRVAGGNPNYFGKGAVGQEDMRVVMQELLAMSRDEKYWPAEFDQWEMREVEHWACEWDKYERASRGERMKRRFV